MFGSKYWGNRYYGGRYWGHSGLTPATRGYIKQLNITVNGPKRLVVTTSGVKELDIKGS